MESIFWRPVFLVCSSYMLLPLNKMVMKVCLSITKMTITHVTTLNKDVSKAIVPPSLAHTNDDNYPCFSYIPEWNMSP